MIEKKKSRLDNQNRKRLISKLTPGSEKLVLNKVDNEKTNRIAPTTGIERLTWMVKNGQSIMKNAVHTATRRLSVK